MFKYCFTWHIINMLTDPAPYHLQGKAASHSDIWDEPVYIFSYKSFVFKLFLSLKTKICHIILNYISIDTASNSADICSDVNNTLPKEYFEYHKRSPLYYITRSSWFFYLLSCNISLMTHILQILILRVFYFRPAFPK